MPDVSVLLTTYERPRALACVLAGYLGQTFRDAEIIVGDDGSGPDTAAVVAAWGDRLAAAGIPLRHVRLDHLDHGRTRVLNAAVRAASGRYLVLSDGDCIPEPDYLARHVAARRPGVFLNGRRLMMDDASRDLSPDDVLAGRHRAADVAASRRDIARLRRKSWWYRALGGLAWSRLRLLGANVSLWRADYEAINGFDEGYIGWGAADEDFRRRLHDAGIRWGDVLAAAHVWHIAHPPIASKPRRVKEGRNAARYDTWCYLARPIDGLRRRDPADLVIACGERTTGPAPGGAAAPGGPAAGTIATSGGAWRPGPDLRLALVAADATRGGGEAGEPGQIAVLLAGRGVAPERAAAAARGWRGRGGLVLAPAGPAAEAVAATGALVAGVAPDRLPDAPATSGDALAWWARHEAALRPLLAEAAALRWLHDGRASQDTPSPLPPPSPVPPPPSDGSPSPAQAE